MPPVSLSLPSARGRHERADSVPRMSEGPPAGAADAGDRAEGAADGGARDGVRLTAFVRGRVQGVGFRWWVRAQALELGLEGAATNLADGRVQVVAEGGRRGCERLLELLGEQPSAHGRPGDVTWVGERWTARRGAGPGFTER